MEAVRPKLLRHRGIFFGRVLAAGEVVQFADDSTGNILDLNCSTLIGNLEHQRAGGGPRLVLGLAAAQLKFPLTSSRCDRFLVVWNIHAPIPQDWGTCYRSHGSALRNL